MALGAIPDRFGRLNPLPPINLITTSAAAREPSPAPESCIAIPLCQQIWDFAQKSYYAMYLLNKFSPSGRKSWDDFLTLIHEQRGVDTMDCSSNAVFGKVCDCVVNAKMIYFLLTGENPGPSDVGTVNSKPYNEATVDLVTAPGKFELGRGHDVFNFLLRDVEANANDVYYVYDGFGRTFHGFVIYKLETTPEGDAGEPVEPKFLVLSAFAANYRLIDWMDGFEHVEHTHQEHYRSLQHLNTASGGHMFGTELKSVAEIKHFLEIYASIIRPLRRDEQITGEHGEIMQKEYENLWGEKNFLKTPVGQTSYCRVFKGTLDVAGFEGRMNELQTAFCLGAATPCVPAEVDPQEMPKDLVYPPPPHL
jgi:hypothetical protein